MQPIMISGLIKRINIWYAALTAAILLGVVFRLYGLGSNGIFFYDEALYLNHSLPGLEFFSRMRLVGADDILKAFLAYLQFPLNFTKPVWILIVDSRYLFTHLTDWDYAKYAACSFGIATLPLAFLFAKRFFNSYQIACLSTAILALLPAHVFYSRLGLQEACSTFLVLAGFYCYLFPREFGKRTFVAGLFFALAYLANYRLIILPVLLLASELWWGLLQKEGLRYRHWVWTMMTFLIVLVIVGSMMGGTQLRYTFAWIFHQQDMAAAKRMWGEAFAYPYYLFRLEGVVLASAFFASARLLISRRWKLAWPFVLVLAQMAIFTLASDRGARYIAIVLPFLAMASAAAIWTAYQDILHPKKKAAFLFLLIAMFLGFIVKDIPLITARSAYRPSVEYLLAKGRGVKFLSTQEIVQRLYCHDRGNIVPAPEDFGMFLKHYTGGYRYLIIDPQAYIAYTGNEYKWGLPLKDHMGFIDKNAPPEKTFTHFNRAVMERVVFEHSDNLWQSIAFLNSADLARMSSLRIYDLSRIVPAMSAFAQKARRE